MQAVPDGPVVAHDGAEAHGRESQRGGVEPGLALGRPADFATTVDDDDAVQAWPGVALLDHSTSWITVVVRVSMRPWSPSTVSSRLIVVFLNSAALCSATKRSTSASKVPCAFQGEDVIGLLVDDLLSDAALTSHCVDGDDRSFDGHYVEELRDRHDLVRLVRHRDLSEHETLTRREGGDHVERRRAGPPVAGATRGLAVDDDHVLRHDLGRAPVSAATQATKQR